MELTVERREIVADILGKAEDILGPRKSRAIGNARAAIAGAGAAD